MKILFAGNCQGPHLAAMFSVATKGVEIFKTKPTFSLTEADKDAVLKSMEGVDFIFAQRTSHKYFLEWLRPDVLRKAFPDKCVIWPNVYFDGYFPKTGYIYKSGIGKLLSPLEDYHLLPLIDAFKRGLTPQQAAAEFPAAGAGAADPFEASFAELERRETDVDVGLADFLRAQTPARRCFYTPNHPSNFVLAELAARLAARAGIAFDKAAAAKLKYRLDHIYIPAFPSLVERFALPFDLSALFSGVEVASVTPEQVVLGGERAYLLRDLIEAYWNIYAKISP